MKRFYHILTLALLVCAISCNSTSLDELVAEQEAAGQISLKVSSENPLLVVNEEGTEGSINFKTRGGEVLVDVITNQEEWNYTATNAEWLDIEADKHFLHIAATRNNSSSSNAATITLTASGKGGGNFVLRNA